MEYLDFNQISFPKLGINVTLKSEAFSIFGVSIQWYGIIITFGIILALIFGFSQMKKYGVDPDRAIDCIIGGFIGGILGARIYYVAMNWDFYSGDIKSIIDIRSGGLAVYGGIIGSILVACIIAKVRKLKIAPFMDIVGMGFLIGQCIGRWGNLFNQEAFGYNTDLPWGMTGGRIQQWIAENSSSIASDPKLISMSALEPVHPCFLYESLWCLLGFGILFLVAKKWRKFDGQIFLMYIAWYGLGRFFIEGMRTDSLYLGNLRVSQVLAILCFIAATILLVVISFKVKRMGTDYVFYKDSEESKRCFEETAAKMNGESSKGEKKNKKKSKDDEKSEPIIPESDDKSDDEDKEKE